nr:hypothetical protein [Halopolyspora algeriensis]
MRGFLLDRQRKSMQLMAKRLGWIIRGYSSSCPRRPEMTGRCGGSWPAEPRALRACLMWWVFCSR